MFITNHKKIFIGVSVFFVLASLISIFIFGINFGIDFKGGALLEISYAEERISKETLQPELDALGYGNVIVQPTGELGYIIKTRDLTEPEHAEVLRVLSRNGQVQMKQENFNSIGPSVGRELTRKAIFAVVLASIAIICFIAYAFRKVSKPVSSWRYGIIAVVALLHDVIIPVGFYSVLSHFYGAEADTLFVVAILTILGLSVADTIVIFDRIRENLREHSQSAHADFAEIVGRSLDQSFARSIATSLTLIFVLVALVFFGPSTVTYFAILLAIGTFFGTYSSIFLASPLLVYSFELQKTHKK